MLAELRFWDYKIDFDNLIAEVELLISEFYDQEVSFEAETVQIKLIADNIYNKIRKLNGKQVSEFKSALNKRMKALKLSVENRNYLFHQNKLWVDAVSTSKDRIIRLIKQINNIHDKRQLPEFIIPIIQDILYLQSSLQFIAKATEHVAENRLYYHVSSISPDKVSTQETMILKGGLANAFNPEGEKGFYMAEQPILYYAGGERERKKMTKVCIFAIPVDRGCIFNIGSRLQILNANSNNRDIFIKPQNPKKLSQLELLMLGCHGLNDARDIEFYLVNARDIEYINTI
jgi:hypothetical protein